MFDNYRIKTEISKPINSCDRSIFFPARKREKSARFSSVSRDFRHEKSRRLEEQQRPYPSEKPSSSDAEELAAAARNIENLVPTMANKSDLLRHDPINVKYRDLSCYLYRTGRKDRRNVLFAASANSLAIH